MNLRILLAATVLGACGGGNPASTPIDGAVAGDSHAATDGTTNSGPARVFITSDFYDGDLKTAGAGTDGLDGADKLCQLHADAAALGGTYRAWLSTSTIDAIDHITGSGPWINTHGETVFANRAQLQTHPLAGVGYDEANHGEYPEMWTGTADGRKAPVEFPASETSSSCNDWTSAAAIDDAATGDSAEGTSAAWTNHAYDACYATHAIYCFQIL